MAHQIQTMAYVGETPWHSLGNALPDLINSLWHRQRFWLLPYQAAPGFDAQIKL